MLNNPKFILLVPMGSQTFKLLNPTANSTCSPSYITGFSNIKHKRGDSVSSLQLCTSSSLQHFRNWHYHHQFAQAKNSESSLAFLFLSSSSSCHDEYYVSLILLYTQEEYLHLTCDILNIEQINEPMNYT